MTNRHDKIGDDLFADTFEAAKLKGGNPQVGKSKVGMPGAGSRLLMILFFLASGFMVLGNSLSAFGQEPARTQAEKDQAEKDLEQKNQTEKDQEKADPGTDSNTQNGGPPPQDGSQVELPWERKRENRIPRITKVTERELLGDVTEEEVLSIADHLPLNQISQHLFAKLLFRVPQFGLDHLARLADDHATTDLTVLEKESGFHRLKVFRVEGRARSWEKRRLVPEVGELFDLSFYYKVKIQTTDNLNVIVYCHQIPKAWEKQKDLNESATFEGLYLNWTLSKEKEAILNFICDRIRWSPRTPTQLVTRQGPSLLGSAGFDLGLLDTLPSRNRHRLDDQDSESFFQMMAAARIVADSRNKPDWASEVPKFNLIETLKNPEKYHGELNLIEMEVRNITRVKVDQDYIRDRIGISSYFQLDGFAKFDSSVTYKGKDGKAGAVFKGKYPISVCIHRLPSGWKPGSNQRYSAIFPVFFYKVWAFPSGFQNQFAEESMQQSPLLIALDPVAAQPLADDVNWTAIGLFAVLGIGLITIWTSYYVGKTRKERRELKFRLPSQVHAEEFPESEEPASSNDEKVPGMPVIRESE